MIVDSDTISLARRHSVGESSPRLRFSNDTDGLRHASLRHALSAGADEAWFWFFLFQATGSVEDAGMGRPTSDTFGSRFHNVGFVQEQEERARERRRSFLIHRKHHSSLTQGETAELELLQAESEAALAAELEPSLDKLRALANEQ